MSRGASRAIWGAGVAILLACLFAGEPGYSQRITLTAADLTGAGFAARGIHISLVGGEAQRARVALIIGTLTVGTRSWKNIRLSCEALTLGETIACDKGVALLGGAKVPIQFRYTPKARTLEAALLPAPGESYRLTVAPQAMPAGLRPRDSAGTGSAVSLRIEGGQLHRVAPWWPAAWPKLTAGTLAGQIDYAADGQVSVHLAAGNLAFADASGRHAGDKLGFTLDAQARPMGSGKGERKATSWQAALTWAAGEAFWQPVYLKAQQQVLRAEGTYDGQLLAVTRGTLHYPGVGDTTFSATCDTYSGALTTARVSTRDIDVQALHAAVLKPFLDGTAFSDIRTEGRVNADVRVEAGRLDAVDVALSQVSFEDMGQHRFALFEVNGNIPWRSGAATVARLTAKGGELLTMPVGAFELPLEMNGPRVALQALRVPLLDGVIEARNFVARAGDSSWYWQFTGGIEGISMARFSTAMGWPVMNGTLAASLPLVRNTRAGLRVDGALALKLFDGTLEAKNLVLLDVFGKAPRVQADVEMRNLDLGLVTRAFSFGSITGRVDATVGGLQLVNWQPVAFDARLASSPGRYRREISQKAVQNISALGGAGATAAIQRSLLRFFDEFGYQRLGWSCRLQDGVCEMGGIEKTAQGYVIVKGGGIPGITVMGYNQRVSWDELLSRLKRVTQGGMQPVIVN